MNQFQFGWIPLIQQELRKFFASKTQGTKADTALQPGAIGESVQPYSANLANFAALSSFGLVIRNDGGVFSTTQQLPAANLAENSVTLAKLAVAVQETLVPSGAIAFTTQSTAPTGWLKANGAALSRTTYAGLFSAIGTTYGAGNGSTTFNLPDLRGEFLRAWDDGRGIDAARVLGSAQGATQMLTGGINSTADASFNRPTINLSNTDSSTNSTGNRLLINNSVCTAESITYSLQTMRPRNVALLAIIKY